MKLIHIRPIHGSTADTPQTVRVLCTSDILRRGSRDGWIYVSSLPAWDAGDPVEGAICPECRAAVEGAGV